MKMEGVFHMPLSAANGYVFDAEQEIAAFKGANPTGRVEAAKAAAHAINCHDELVAELKNMRDRFFNMLVGTGTAPEFAVAAVASADAILNKAKG